MGLDATAAPFVHTDTSTSTSDSSNMMTPFEAYMAREADFSTEYGDDIWDIPDTDVFTPKPESPDLSFEPPPCNPQNTPTSEPKVNTSEAGVEHASGTSCEIVPDSSGERFKSPIISLLVGGENMSFLAHKAVLSQSPWLSSLLLASKEALSLHLPLEDPTTFGRILNYLYSGNFSVEPQAPEARIQELCKTYIVVARFQLDVLQSRLLQWFQQIDNLAEHGSLFFKYGRLIYQENAADEPFRNFFRETALICLQNDERLDESAVVDLVDIGGVFARDVTKTLMEAWWIEVDREGKNDSEQSMEGDPEMAQSLVMERERNSLMQTEIDTLKDKQQRIRREMEQERSDAVNYVEKEKDAALRKIKLAFERVKEELSLEKQSYSSAAEEIRSLKSDLSTARRETGQRQLQLEQLTEDLQLQKHNIAALEYKSEMDMEEIAQKQMNAWCEFDAEKTRLNIKIKKLEARNRVSKDYL